ncbi:MAG: alpha/beta hydrolase [Myxococcales bacterium]|nr:alpha/beta hydrolase [Myxococcales bacterium]
MPRLTRTVTTASHRVVYEVEGRGEPTLLFIHGAASTREVWDEARPHFVDDHRVITLDLPGHGASSESSSYAASDFAEAVTAVMNDAAVERAVIVGHSFGVSVARDVALAMPERVAALQMVDGFLVPLGGGIPALVDPLLASFASDDWEQAAEGFIDQFMIGANTPDDIADRVRSMMLASEQATWLGTLTVATSPEVESDEVIDVPVAGWFLPGVTLPASYEDYLRERFPQLEMSVAEPGTGHFLMWERPDELVTRVQALLDRAP